MKSNKQLISIIVPFYKGNQYMKQLLGTIEANVMNMRKTLVKVELLLVNDSPGMEIEYDKNRLYPFEIRCMSMKKNSGIHGARCYGIRNAKGYYILMLDQDDTLSDTWLKEQYCAIKGKDLAISNVIYCSKKREEKLYNSEKEMHTICNKWELCLEKNKIVSPGQVLLKKEIIPKEWLCCRMKHNGADDYFLWILLFEKKRKIAYNVNTFYYHRYSKESVSNRGRLIRKSEKEMAALICKYRLVNWIRRVIYRYRFLKG